MADGAASNRAIAYVRVSTTRQAEVGNSIASQSTRIQKYAKDRGLRLMSTHPLKGNRMGTPSDWTKEILLIDRFFFRGASLENENIQKAYLRIVTKKFDGESVVCCITLLV